MRRQIRSRNKGADRLPVDAGKLNMGNTYSSAPEFYYDIEFHCDDCGVHQIWTARQQKWWYEEAGGYFFATAVRCRDCRQKDQERKRKARVAAGHETPGHR
ncbi:MAG: zinc-ribbon domain containing protein [Halioglobus sp.]|nr:zinc-ribbon domain containing protein [Halioglobus sp.]